jgi:hypothetical protein
MVVILTTRATRLLFVILTKRITRAASDGFWPPDSFALCVILTTGAIATGGTDLGQLREREAGSGSELLPSTNDNKENQNHILKTPKPRCSAIGAFIDAAIPSASAARVSTGSSTPSSHNRALE